MTEFPPRPHETRQQQVCVIDDDDAVLDAIRLRLRSEGINGRFFSTAEKFLESVSLDGPPMCVVSDVRLPGLSGLELQRELQARRIDAPFILITGHGDIEMAVRAMKAGALEFFEKPFNPIRLTEAIREAIKLGAAGKNQRHNLRDLRERVGQLSERQRQVMDLAVLGFSNKEIAQKLSIGPRTVESYRATVMEKTGASNLAALVRIALQLEQHE